MSDARFPRKGKIRVLQTADIPDLNELLTEPLDPRVAQRFRNGFGRFRYGAAVQQPRPQDINTLEDVLGWMSTFADILAKGLDEAAAERRRLERIEDDVKAMRRVLGTDDA